MAQDTQEIDEMGTEIQAVDVPVQPRRGAPRPQYKALFEENKKL